ncbi:hypothetical protein AXG93_2912s1020 [Marchantia polymorpha subsp. ruderalis]|uniref:Uncharacterized protein n=1 Tax=Marchantia polymorpha subsp. ruderalis TaxID=1480154 RepID=A0A176WHM6_MARPO|nr:hypothetical protein AXG93_2912s1020 [Marchantia polymorpha subsp. ruderalis]
MCDKIAKHSAPLGESQSGRERVRTGPGPGQGLGRGLGLLTVREKPDNLSTNCVPDSTQYRTGQEETGDGVGSNTNRNRSGALREPDQEICRSRGGRDTWRSGAVGARRANGAGLRFVRWGCRRSAGREKGEGETERKPLEPSAFAQENLRRASGAASDRGPEQQQQQRSQTLHRELSRSDSCDISRKIPQHIL